MDSRLPDVLDVDISSFEKLISTYVRKMGFDIESMEETADGDIHYTAKTVNPMGGSLVSLIRAGPYEDEVDQSMVEDLYGDMQEKGALRAAFITTSDFTQDAVDYARGKPISLINKYELMESLHRSGVSIEPSFLELLEKHGLAEERFMGEKHAFEVGMTEEAAAAYFRRRARGKKLGFFGGGEELEAVGKRYAPVGVFKLTWQEGVGGGGGPYSKMEKEDHVFVNLSNLDLYYLTKKRSGYSSKYSIGDSDILADIDSLPEGSKKHLIDLLDHGSLPLDHLEGKDLAILQSKGVVSTHEGGGKTAYSNAAQNLVHIGVYVIQELMDFVTILIQDVFGEAKSDIDRELYQVESGGEGKKQVSADINLPHLRGGVYNLRRFLSVERDVASVGREDKVGHSSKSVAGMLSSLFGASVEPGGVVFMPYYTATFRSSDPKKGVRREILIAPLFITEDKPKKARKFRPPKKKEAGVIEGIDYRLIR